jgi:hypothetical protein
MDPTERNLALALVCIGIAACVVSLLTRSPTASALAILPLGLAAWRLYAAR